MGIGCSTVAAQQKEPVLTCWFPFQLIFFILVAIVALPVLLICGVGKVIAKLMKACCCPHGRVYLNAAENTVRSFYDRGHPVTIVGVFEFDKQEKPLDTAASCARKLAKNFLKFRSHIRKSCCFGYYWQEIAVEDINFDKVILLADDEADVDSLCTTLCRKHFSGDVLWSITVLQQEDRTFWVFALDHAIADGVTLTYALKTAFTQVSQGLAATHKKRRVQPSCCTSVAGVVAAHAKLARMTLTSCCMRENKLYAPRKYEGAVSRGLSKKMKIADLKAIAKAQDGSLNELLCTMIGETYARMYKQLNDSSHQRRPFFFIPVNTRLLGDPKKIKAWVEQYASGSAGNVFHVIFPRLVVDRELNFEQRFREQRRILGSNIYAGESFLTYLASEIVAFFGSWFLYTSVSIEMQSTLGLFTNVHGPEELHAFEGSMLNDMYFMCNPWKISTLFTFVSYNGYGRMVLLWDHVRKEEYKGFMLVFNEVFEEILNDYRVDNLGDSYGGGDQDEEDVEIVAC